jgi:hypothetical protein
MTKVSGASGVFHRWNLFPLRRILVRVEGGADMPLHGPIPEGRAFFCPHCGALYSVTHSRRSKGDSNSARCVVCQQIMDDATPRAIDPATWKRKHVRAVVIFAKQFHLFRSRRFAV